VLRGRHRAFIDRATNHRERWLWRVIEVPLHRLVASGEQESELLAVNAALTLLKHFERHSKRAPTKGAMPSNGLLSREWSGVPEPDFPRCETPMGLSTALK
jgi:hypothetical protein